MDFQKDKEDLRKPFLADGEYIVWQGKPEKGHFFTSRDIVMIPFSIFWLSFSLYWEMSAIKVGVFTLWGLPFVAIGVYLLFGRLIHRAYLRNKTSYFITNRRVIITRGNKVEMHDGRDLPPMHIQLHKNGNGTVVFSEEEYGRRGRRYITYFALENIADVAGAQNAISQMGMEKTE